MASSEEIKERLRRFLEVHNKAKILSTDEGMLRMHILHAKNRNDKIKDKIINFLLLRISERLLENPPKEKDLIICEFLIEEIEKYVASSLKEKG